MDDRILQGVYSHQRRVVVRGEPTDMISIKPFSGKFNEKELMHGLNGRLAEFIEKVHQLERHNHLLEREIEDIRGKAKPAACLEGEYGPELQRLRQLVQDIAHQKHQIEIDHQNLEEELSNLKRQHEQETRNRAHAESNIIVLKKDMNEAYQAKLQLDKKAQSLVDEIHFLKRNHEAEVSEVFNQIQDAELSAKDRGFGDPGVTAALREIRAQLEGHTATDVQQMGETFRSQFARLTEAAETKREALKATQQEIQEYRRRMQAKNIELDCAKGTREALEKQLHDVEDRHKEEIIHYQNTIKELENELINCKFDMSAYLREYQDLLNVKMALDVEILSYRKLLCGEEARLSTVSDSHISLPYIYHQSPTYTLPCLSRPGGSRRRVEPQYKFVEEIITETTREIELSEFEETGSEETEVGKDELHAKREGRGSSEEEGDNKDSGEEEGDQMCGGQQNQVAAEDNSGNKSVGESPNIDEREETEAADNNKDLAKNTQREVLVKKEEDKLKRVAETTQEKEASVTVRTVQPDLSSTIHDLVSDIPVEGELRTKSEVRKEDNFVSTLTKKPVDETAANKTQEQSNAQDHASEAGEKTTESPLSTEAGTVLEKAQAVSSSSTNKDVEIKGMPTEPNKINTSDAKSERLISNTVQDAKHKSNREQDSESGL